MAHAFILGASSTLGRALARQLAARGWKLTITGRDTVHLTVMQADLEARHHAKVLTLVADVENYDPAALLARAETVHGPVTHLFTLPGFIGNEIEKVARVNYTGVAAMLEAAREKMQAADAGQMVVVSSIAGDRGRGSNYVYGAAKAALTTYANGLRHALRKTKVKVLVVKPGFIDSPMTQGQNLPLVAAPEDVAEAILKAMDKGKAVVYVPWFWWGIMLIIRNLPEFIFRRVNL